MTSIEDACAAYIREVREEFDERINAWRVDLAQQEVHEVIGALLSRQVTLAVEVASCPHLWTAHVGPIMLRAMADVHISVAWILGAPRDRARKFIEYGLGQVKLMLEHRRQRIVEAGEKVEDDPVIPVYESWVDSQRWLFLTEVNVGTWSGITTRKMAEEAGCLDFYNNVYMPFSAATHSTWHHLSRLNLRRCTNALHRFHAVGAVHEAPPDPWNLLLGAKYADKTFRLFDSKVSIEARRSAYSNLQRTLDKIGRAQEEASASSDDSGGGR